MNDLYGNSPERNAKSIMSTAYCRACLAEYEYSTDNYVLCGSCRSWNLPPVVDALHANKTFYDEIYDDLESVRSSQINKRIFTFFSNIDKKRQKSAHDSFRRIFDDYEIKTAGRKVLEVGFGQGRHLLKLLRAGVDAYGIDLSGTAVQLFQDKHPRYRERVAVGSRYSSQVDVVYSSAMFEHLEKPEDFIADASRALSRGGLLLLDALPVAIAEADPAGIDHDINFWKPCHRAIYSVAGLRMLFGRQGFRLCGLATLDTYNNRVLSQYLTAGYGEMARLRNATVIFAGMPNAFEFVQLCLRALSCGSVAHYGRFVIMKDA